MSDGNLEEFEPSFNIDDLAREFLLDSSTFSSETSGLPVSSPFLENSVQQNNTLQTAGSSQVSGMNMDVNSSMTRNPVNTSGSMLMDGLNNPVGGYSSSSSSVYGGVAPNQNLSRMISQIDQYQWGHQVRPQLGEMPNSYTSSARLGAHNLSYQIQQQQNQSTASAMLQQQRSTGHQSPSPLMMRKRDSSNVIQHAEQPNLEQKRQKFSRQVQMQQTVNNPSGLLSEHAQPKLMASAFPQSQPRSSQLANQIIYENQHQQFQGHPQVQMPISADWAHQALHQITQLKSAWLLTMETKYRNLREQRSQAQNNEKMSKLETMIRLYGQMLTFLRMSKSDIEKHTKERIYTMIRYFKSHVEGAKNSLHVQQAQQNDASFSQMITPQLHHRAIAPQYYGALPNIPAPSRQKRPLSLDASPRSSFQVGSAVGVQMLDASSNQHSLTRSTQNSPSQVPQRVSISAPQEGSKLGYEQGSPVTHPHSSSGVPRQFTYSAQPQKVTSSRNRFNPLESSSNEKNNILNIAKSAQHSLSVEQMQQIMQKRNSGSPLRHLVGVNKSSSSSFNVPSPQSQYSGSLVEFPKSRTPSLGNSPLPFPSPLNPLTPISRATDPEFSSLSLEASNKASTASPALVQPAKRTEPVMERLVSSTDPSIPDKTDAHKPIDRLINAIKAMSPAAWQSISQDISAIMEMSDRMTTFRHGEHTEIVKDLSGEVRTHNDWAICGIERESRMKRQLDSVGWMSEKEHLENYMPMKERNEELLLEIEETNKKLMEVVLNAGVGHDEETSIIRCSYCPIRHHGNDIRNTSPEEFPYLALELKVTGDYPHSSPIILESEPPSCSEAQKGKEMWLKTMSDFSSAIRTVEQPISLRDIAKTWEVCARKVYVAYAVENGGGTFSTKYGEWQYCE